MGKITLFDDRNFAGCSCAATTDQPAQLNPCNSVKVENGCWMVYEHPNYTGHQFFLRKGEYPDNQHWMGFNDSIRSCCIITAENSPYCLQPQEHRRLQICERNAVRGKMLEFMNNCPSLQDDFDCRDIWSYIILEGTWVFYE